MAKKTTNSERPMTVNQAGQRGGQATRDKYGREFYEDIGRRGGQRVKELIEQGKQAETGLRPAKGD